jgi:MFS family permease
MEETNVTQNLNLQEIERRVKHSAYQDGLIELFLGGFLLLFGILFAVQPRLSVFSFLALFVLLRLFERAKQRYIYPRVGYVKLKEEQETDLKGIVIATLVFIVILLGALGLFVLTLGGDKGWNTWFNYFFPAFTGLMMAIGPFWLGQTYGLKRGYILATLFLLSGIAFPVLGIARGYAAVSATTLLVGLVALLSGALRFARFLRAHPAEELPDVQH